MAIAGVVVLCMSSNYVIVRHRRDVGMAPALLLAGVISAIAALPFARPGDLGVPQMSWLLALGPGPAACCCTWQASSAFRPGRRPARAARAGAGTDLGVGDRRRKAGRPHDFGRRHRHRFRSGKCVAGFAPAHWLRTPP
jgi:hypothetical protein